MSACSRGEDGVVLARCCIESEQAIDKNAMIKASHFRNVEIMGIIIGSIPSYLQRTWWFIRHAGGCMAHGPPRNAGNNTIVMPNYGTMPGSDIRQRIMRRKGQKILPPETGFSVNSGKNSRYGKKPAHIGLGSGFPPGQRRAKTSSIRASITPRGSGETFPSARLTMIALTLSAS